MSKVENPIPIYSKSLGIDDVTGSEVIIEVFSFSVSSDDEEVIVFYKLKFLSPKQIPLKMETASYIRLNRPDLYYYVGEMMDDGNISDGTQIKIQGNMKFDLLRNSQVGQMLAGLFKLDIDSIKSIQTIDTDLAQK